ncbi:TrkH family potassium uptake protein [Archangium violaceum]|uniref:TrkH family potassium uptake protein n=1 Tax=Archangium violaceum TaxID=83451 RepID=UPI0007C80C78|nr:potassium transporter TrkG [Archangium violaceum]
MPPRTAPTRLLVFLRHRWHGVSPSALLALSFAILITLGTAGLMLLPGMYRREPLGFLDALFTMTSATCVTGLTVVDTATWFTRWGQLWILLFIQLGGIGLITLTTLVIGAVGRRLSLRSEVIVGAPIDYAQRQNVTNLAWAVTRFTLLAETLGAFALWLVWLPRFGASEAAWHAVFHSVSAFCNAGFSTFSDSLIGMADQPLVLLIISVLIILGGLGFLSGEETLRWWRGRHLRGRQRMSVHTFAALWVTAILLVGGTLLFALFEWRGVLGPLGLVDKLSNAWFLSVTARTAGFNTVSYAQVANSTAFLTILLMVIGGSPGSTAGGLKTTTLAVLVTLALARMRGRRFAELHGRALPTGTTERTVSLALVAFVVMTAAIFLLSLSETRGATPQEARQAFLPLFFEVVSAFCTVGLTMDLSPLLSGFGKLLVIVLMYVGRLGPLAFFAALSLHSAGYLRRSVRPAHEDLIVG